MTSKLRISTILAPVFHPVHRAVKSGEVTEFWLRGGRGSTKSSFVALEIVLGIMRDPEANAMCLRKVGDTIRGSLLTTFLWAISILGVSQNFRATVSPAEITYLPTGQKIIMKGLDDPLKLKSVKAQQGYFKYLWFEEAAEFNGMEEIRNVEQSVLRGGERFVEFVTYNPPNDPDAWINVEAEMPNNDRFLHNSTYLDVPVEWLGQKFIEKAERLKANEPLKYEHEYMGKAVGNSEQTVMNGKWKSGTRTITEEWHGPYDGVDWGFSTDPTVRIRMWLSPDQREAYVEKEAVGYHVELNDIAELFTANIPRSRQVRAYADCSRPETISHVKNQGFEIEACEKWPGSVEDGIAHLRGYDVIIVNPECVHTISEMCNYSYKVDKLTKKVTADIIDKYNHCIDAMRYALGPLIQRKSRGWFD